MKRKDIVKILPETMTDYYDLSDSNPRQTIQFLRDFDLDFFIDTDGYSESTFVPTLLAKRVGKIQISFLGKVFN